jgi:hypothetical protein
MKFAVVTTFAKRHWAEHAKRCVDSMAEFWDGAIARWVIGDDETLYMASPWLDAFKRRHASKPTQDYRMDAVRFAHKVAAIDLGVDWARNLNADVLIWLDADCVTHAKVDPRWLEGLLKDGDFAYLKRTMKYPECGVMMFRLNPRGTGFIDAIVRQYRDDKLFDMAEWHDSYVIDQVRAQREAIGMLRSVSLSGAGERTHHPLINGPLGERLDHLKGPRKGAGKSNARDLKVRRPEPYWAGMNDAAAQLERMKRMRQEMRERRAARQVAARAARATPQG